VSRDVELHWSNLDATCVKSVWRSRPSVLCQADVCCVEESTVSPMPGWCLLCYFLCRYVTWLRVMAWSSCC